jgi:chorismate mutase
MRHEPELNNIRSALIRLEETIIFALIERSQFGRNGIIYQDDGVKIPGHTGSYMMYFLHETEKYHARVRRYTAPDENPFTKNLPEPFVISSTYVWPIKKTDININDKILSVYINEIIPLICSIDDDGNYGSSSVNDVNILQALSKRIHYGKFVAESKYQKDTAEYDHLIQEINAEEIMKKLTDEAVENEILERVRLKAMTYGQEPNAVNLIFKVKPAVIQDIYFKYIIPFTKEVEVMYLIKRLD